MPLELKTVNKLYIELSQVEAEARRNLLDSKHAIRRRAIKRQLRRLGIEIPASARFNLNALRAIRRDLLVMKGLSPIFLP